jgi:hypothetical protein
MVVDVLSKAKVARLNPFTEGLGGANQREALRSGVLARAAEIMRQCRSSYKGHTGDTLAPAAEEGRGRQRKVGMSRQRAKIPEYPNGATHWGKTPVSIREYIAYGR